MNEFISALQSNTLPTAYWIIVVAWGLALSIQLALLQRESAEKHLSARQVAGPVIMGALIFSISYASSDQVQAFFAGGWCITAIVSLACGIYWHRLAVKGLASPPRRRLNVLLVATCVLALLGIALTQLALLGASLFLAATSLGYFRKQAMPRHNA